MLSCLPFLSTRSLCLCRSLSRPPDAPRYHVPWDELQTFPFVRELLGCPQDPIHHAGGNVWIHTRMVLDTLVAMPAYRALAEVDKAAAYLGCLLHDVAKPFTTKTEDDGRITAKEHSRAGEMLARRLLWELGTPFLLREMVCGLIRYHQIPFYLIERGPGRVPEAVIRKMSERWEIPSLMETHSLDIVLR